MRLNLLMFFGLLVLALPVALAETQVNIEVQPFNDATVLILDPSQDYYLLYAYEANSGPYGVINFSFEAEKSVVNIRVIEERRGDQVQDVIFEEVSTFSNIDLDLFEEPDNFNTLENDQQDEEGVADLNATSEDSSGDVENLEEDSEINTDDSGTTEGVTGNAISDELVPVSGTSSFYYLIGAIVLAGIIGFVLVKRFGSGKVHVPKKLVPKRKRDVEVYSPTYEFKGQPVKASEYEDKEDSDDEIEDAEQRIKDLEKEISTIRKKEKLIEAQKRFEEAKKDLERLKDERDN